MGSQVTTRVIMLADRMIALYDVASHQVTHCVSDSPCRLADAGQPHRHALLSDSSS